MGEKTIPILPCPSIPDVVAFYQAIGFEVTHLQTSPNPYASLRYGGIDLQFFGLKSVDPAASMSTCYVVTDRVNGLYAAFRGGLKQALGKIPTRGIPRIGQLKDTTYGVRQFLMTDPGGNCIRIGQPTGESLYHAPAPTEPFARALHNAWLLGVSKGEPAQGARILDRALQRESPASAAERVRAPFCGPTSPTSWATGSWPRGCSTTRPGSHRRQPPRHRAASEVLGGTTAAIRSRIAVAGTVVAHRAQDREVSPQERNGRRALQLKVDYTDHRLLAGGPHRRGFVARELDATDVSAHRGRR